MEQEPKTGFRHWFVNVFWFHYGKLAIGLVLALAVVIYLTVDAFHKESYDLNVVLAVSGAIEPEDTQALQDLLAETAGDLDGDGKIQINLQRIDLRQGQELERMILYLSLPEYTLFILDDEISANYCAREDEFQPLADYGVETEDPSGKRRYVGDRTVLRQMGEFDYYLCLADWTVDGKGSPEMTAAAVRAMQKILNSEVYEGAV